MLKNSTKFTKLFTSQVRLLLSRHVSSSSNGIGQNAPPLKDNGTRDADATKAPRTRTTPILAVPGGPTPLITPEFGLLFDIDGVLVRGKTLLPHTKHCIRLITDTHGNFRVPTVFVTNAGNELRSTKAAKLSQFLGVRVDPNQVIMSHSPLKLFKQFHSKRCLVSGQGPIVDIAKNLGFKSLITVDELRQYHPYLDVVDHKRRSFAPCALGRYFPPIEAIVLFGESIRWETNLQLIVDVLMSNGKLDPASVAGEHRFPLDQLPILACNADMVWMAEAPLPRFGHGVFLHCLEQIYSKLSGRELKYQCIVGKPNEITYYYAEQMVQRHAEQIGVLSKVRRLYAIGDNLDTDIYGANVYNLILDNNRRSREKKQIQQQQQQEQEENQQQALAYGSLSTVYQKSSMSNKMDMNSTASSNADSETSRQKQQQRCYSSTASSSSSMGNYIGSNPMPSYTSETESIRSILVRTGVSRSDEPAKNADSAANNSNAAAAQEKSRDQESLSLAHKDMIVDPSLMKPNYVSDNVFEAVKLVYKIENFS